MNKTRTLLFGTMVAGAMIFGGVIGATGLAKAVTSAHEAGESTAREAAETAGVKPSSTP